MSFTTPAMVVSGKPYPVLLVAGRTPDRLADFADAADFTIDMEGQAYQVQGIGRVIDDEVRYHEKDINNSGKDIRVWRVTQEEAGSFLANHDAAF